MKRDNSARVSSKNLKGWLQRFALIPNATPTFQLEMEGQNLGYAQIDFNSDRHVVIPQLP